MIRAHKAEQISRTLLRRMPLPSLDDDDDKNARGQVLVIGGTTAVPGAILLAGIGALRAGAGKLQLATVRDAAIHLALAVPEAMVVSLPMSRAGGISDARAPALLKKHAPMVDAVLVGPGMDDHSRLSVLLSRLVRMIGETATLVLDAAAAVSVRRDEKMLMPLTGRAVLTPHTGEMATILGIEKSDVESNAAEVARLAADRFGAVVALKGSESWIAEPGGRLLCYRGGSVGLATSGSGDTLAGIVAGLAARGASPITAAAWGVWAHGTAGERLAKRIGKVGFLARELLAEVPGLL